MGAFRIFVNEPFKKKWVPVSSTDKVSDDYIRDLGFNPYLHQKMNDVLV